MDSRWGKLPYDLIECIVERLGAHIDILNFRLVCTAWKLFVSKNLYRFPRQLPLSRCLPQQCQLPLLMIPSAEETMTRDYFCLSEQKIYGGFLLPETYKKWICGSSHGWLVTNDVSGSKLHLLNPFTRTRLCLPSSTTIPQPKCDTRRLHFETFYYVPKVVLSGNPTSNTTDCSIMAIATNSCILSFCRPGDSKWTNINSSPCLVHDIIFYKGQFYAVNDEGLLVVCDIGQNPKATPIAGKIERHLGDTKRYLVESSGELLQVVRQLTYDETECDLVHASYKTIKFQVFKLEEKGAMEKERKDEEKDDIENYYTIESVFAQLRNSKYKWIEVESLGDQMLFLGLNNSISLSARSFPNCKENCIYFIDDYMDYHFGRHFGDITEVCHDMGMFDLTDGSVSPYLPMPIDFHMPPIWVTPALW